MATEPAVLVEKKNRVGVVTLNRPNVLNALSPATMTELGTVLAALEEDGEVGAILITGSERAFAAGADISQMAERDAVENFLANFGAPPYSASDCRKPIVAAVSGYALGGGCELAAMCDVIIAAENAKFGQPEIKIGVLPGWGGSQRLARSIGKAKTMDLCLTGRMMGAEEAERCGLVSRVVPTDKLLEEAMSVAETIAAFSLPAAMMVKEAVGQAFESSLSDGLKHERRLFHLAFSLDDQTEGMNAFLEKREPNWKHR